MNTSTTYAVRLSNLSARDLRLVGGKGANLAEMIQTGFPIPPGFCLTTKAFHLFLSRNPDQETLFEQLENITPNNLKSVRRVGKQVRESLLQTPIPSEIAVEALKAWRDIGNQHAYAVRSSATAEDLPDASFAGQQDTYLNIIGEDALLNAIRRCWASLFTDRAILYRCKKGFGHREVGLSVVVQQMILADKSGILFTADPLTGHRHTLTIDASFGLGEALVSGLVSPDNYRVDKRTMSIIHRQIANKEVAILPQPQGGTTQIAISANERTTPSITDEQVRQLAEWGMRIEAHYGNPQDIEWAISESNIFILQSRPITSLYPIENLASPDDTMHIFFSAGHQQNMTGAMSPLSLSTLHYLFPLQAQENDPYSVIRFSGGRMFGDLTSLLRHPLAKHIVPRLLSQFDVLAPEALGELMKRPEFRGEHNAKIPRSGKKVAFGVTKRILLALTKTDLTGFVPKTNALIADFQHKSAQNLTSDAEYPIRINKILDYIPSVFAFFLNWVPEAAAGIIATRLLSRLATPYLSPNDVDALTLGVTGNVVNEMNVALDEVSKIVGQSPKLAASFEKIDSDIDSWMTSTRSIEGSERFFDALNSFLSRYGARGPSEIDIAAPRWNENPLPVLRVIAGHIQNGTDFQEHFNQLAHNRKQVFDKLLKKVGKSIFGGLRTRVFHRLYHVMTEVGGMREHHKFVTILSLWEVKKVLKSVASNLVAAGRITHQDDIWFLTWPELKQIWDNEDENWGNIIAKRRSDMVRYQNLTPPLVISSDGETPVVKYQRKNAPDGALLGNPVSPGIVEGVIHVIYHPQAETLAPGEILVTKFTDPGWTPLFINASALVMETGGALAHGSIVAREYGIPAVVGVQNATNLLKTGQLIRVNGNSGYVEILSEV